MNPSFGVNLGGIAPQSSNQVFLDYFKQAEWYIFNPAENWFTRQNDNLLETDAQGWLKSLPSINGKTQPVMAAVLWDKWHPPGRYVIEYKGKGELSTDYDVIESSPGRLVIDLKDGKGESDQLQIYIDSTDPNGTGNYIRDIQVFREQDEELVKAGEIYRPEFLDKVSGFRTLRYMDWLTTNFSKVRDWNPAEQRVSRSRYINQVPYEAIATLANQTKTDVWINIPHRASDQFVRQAARYLKQNVDPSLRIYVEYSNEHFTEGFDQHEYMKRQGRNRWGNTIQNPGEQFYGARAAEITKIFRQEFGNQKQSRLFPVLTFQASDRDVSSVLDAPASVRAGNIAPKNAGFRIYSVDTYFGFEFGDPDNFATLRRWMREPDRGIEKVRRAIETGEGLPLNFSARQDLETDYAFHRQMADELGWEYNSYEGGSGITTQDIYDANEDGVNDAQDIVDYLIFLNRHPVLKQAYRKHYQTWRDNGGELALHYADIGFPEWYGSWGLYESVYDRPNDRSPRADLIFELNDERPNVWSDRRPGRTFQNGRLIRGSKARNILTGTAFEDRMFGLAGNDRLEGKAGHDLLVGSEGADYMVGGSGNDTLVGGAGGDRQVGGAGRDTYRWENLRDSTLSQRDRIQGLQIGTDILDGPRALGRSKIAQLGRAKSLASDDIQQVLTPGRFKARQGATFRVGDRTFLALNNGTHGFQAHQDAVIEITGFSGSLRNLSIR